MIEDRIRGIRRATVRGYVIFRKVIEKLMTGASRPTGKNIEYGPKLSLTNAVVIITGSSAGIGFILAKAFAEAGASVVLNGRSTDSLAHAHDKLKAQYPNIIAVQADVAKYDDAQRLIRKAIETFGRIDILINNAGETGPIDKKMWELKIEEWKSVIDSNLTGAYLCSTEMIRWAKSSKHHVRIINVSSGIVNHGFPYLGAYNISKMGMEGLTISLSADCEENDPLISVLSIKPRSVRTGMTKRFFSRTEYALMDAPEILAPIFLYAATAPVNEIMGKSLSEPAFSADPGGEVILNNRYSAVQSWRPQPEYYKQDDHTKQIDKSCTYMHLLQNPMGYYPAVAGTISKNIYSPNMHGYPDPDYPELKSIISEQLKIESKCITFGAGSSELLDRTLRTFCDQRSNIVITKPTWGWIWNFLLRYGIRPVEVPCLGTLSEKNIRHDLEGILNAINLGTRLVYLVNPCNPTGSIVSKDALKDFLYKVPSHVTVILDEAYIDYCEMDKRFLLPDHLINIPCRVIGLRTFSKFYSMGGFRIGYAYGKQEVINFLDRAEVPFNISNIAQLAAIAALNDRVSQEQTYANNLSEHRRIGNELEKMKIDYMPTQTNFILFNCPLDKAKMRASLKERGIFMPNIDQMFIENYALMTIGLQEHNQKILDFLSKF